MGLKDLCFKGKIVRALEKQDQAFFKRSGILVILLQQLWDL